MGAPYLLPLFLALGVLKLFQEFIHKPPMPLTYSSPLLTLAVLKLHPEINIQPSTPPSFPPRRLAQSVLKLYPEIDIQPPEEPKQLDPALTQAKLNRDVAVEVLTFNNSSRCAFWHVDRAIICPEGRDDEEAMGFGKIIFARHIVYYSGIIFIALLRRLGRVLTLMIPIKTPLLLTAGLA